MNDLTAEDVMTEDPMTVELGAKVRDAIQILQTLEIRHLPVVDAGGQLQGMVSDRDLRNARIPYTLPEETGPELQSLLDRPITDVMTSEPERISSAASISEIIDLLLELRVGALPVVDEATAQLVGIVSYVDVLRAARRSVE